MRNVWSVTGTVAIVCASVTGCTVPRQDQRDGTAMWSNTEASYAIPFQVGVVTDTRGLNDIGTHDDSVAGLQRSELAFDCTGGVIQSHTTADYVPNVNAYAKQGYQLIVADGKSLQPAVATISRKHPRTNFLILGAEATASKNVAGAVFKTEEGAYALGYLAGLLEREKALPGLRDKSGRSVVLLEDIHSPNEMREVRAFATGLHASDAALKARVISLPPMFGTATIEKASLGAIQTGADILYGPSSSETMPMIDAAKGHQVYLMTGSRDSLKLDPKQVLGSAMPATGVAVYNTVKAVDANEFRHTTTVYTLKNHGIDLHISSICPLAARLQMDHLIADMSR
ncbi:BMP family protein [Alicyclobacillus sp. SP_1]|uniref:BMP family lipoprotein n=1 Tax=Alicyclobacillus sp. SP_1 TaxID=2942475 RepID=UPI0021573AFF|nr:BMP family ABC transporter substrate-binding protein [Alicyclobacillus sp. SP_1]